MVILGVKVALFFYPHTAVKQNKITKDCFIGTMFVFLSSWVHADTLHQLSPQSVQRKKLCSAPMKDFLFIIIIKAWSTQAIYIYFLTSSLWPIFVLVYMRKVAWIFLWQMCFLKNCAPVLCGQKKKQREKKKRLTCMQKFAKKKHNLWKNIEHEWKRIFQILTWQMWKVNLQLSLNWTIFFQCLIFHFPPYITVIKNAACFTYNKFLPVYS